MASKERAFQFDLVDWDVGHAFSNGSVLRCSLLICVRSTSRNRLRTANAGNLHSDQEKRPEFMAALGQKRSAAGGRKQQFPNPFFLSLLMGCGEKAHRLKRDRHNLLYRGHSAEALRVEPQRPLPCGQLSSIDVTRSNEISPPRFSHLGSGALLCAAPAR